MKKSRFSERRQRFFDLMDDGVALFPACLPSTRNSDVEYPFRADSDFFFLTGLEEPDAWAVLKKENGNCTFDLYLRSADPEQEVWQGKRVGLAGAKKDYGADNGLDVTSFFDNLPAILENRRRLYYAFGQNPAFDARILAVTNSLKGEARRGVSGPWEIFDPRTITWKMRLIKTKQDIADHQKACDITAEAFKAALRAVKPGMREYELAAVVNFEFSRRGSTRVAFDTICASGANAATLHYTSNDAVIKPDDMILIDAGAEFGMVTSDISRTFPASGVFPKSGKTVYEWVLKAQKAAIKAVRPGVTYAEIHKAALEVLCQGLIQMKVLSGTVDSLIESGDYRPYFMHRIGHWLGLDVHDVGPYFVDGSSIKIEPGMIITIEPGLYFRSQPEVPAQFRGIGVRIEDDVVVTESGCRVMTAGVPKDVKDIESFMAENISWWDSIKPVSTPQN